MVCIWYKKQKGKHKTFGQHASCILNAVLREGEVSSSKRLNIVFEIYKEHSIKETKRSSRGPNKGGKYKSIVAWINFLTNSNNNFTSLIKLLVHEWQKPTS